VSGLAGGLLLAGRHGLFTCYEAFIHIVDSMLNQHVTWLKVSRGIPWRALFPPARPVILAFHGYPWLIHRLT
jgi:phosphoketolase